MEHVMHLHRRPPPGCTQEELAMMLKTAELINKKLPDAKWMYQALFVLNNGHRIFDPAYRHVRQRQKVSANNLPCFSNDDGFFNDAVPRESKGKKQRLMRIPKAEKLRMKKEALEARITKDGKNLDQVDADIKAEYEKVNGNARVRFNPF